MKSRWVIGALAVPLAWGSFASADPLVLTLDHEFSGAQAPAGYLVATFDDVTPNVVSLKLESHLADGEFVKGNKNAGTGWFFNFNDAKDVLALEIEPNPTLPVTAEFFLGKNDLKADGDGFYDILFTFISEFDGTDSLEYTIKGGDDQTINAQDFNFVSSSTGASGGNSGNGTFLSAAHVQGVFKPTGGDGNTDGSGWIAPDPGAGGPGTLVPLPPVVLGGALLMGLIARGRTRSKI